MAAAQVLQMTTALFAITAPVAVLPIFVGMTAGQSVAEQRHTAVIGTITFVAVAVLSVLLGDLLLDLFALTVPTLTLAGMIVIGAVGWQLVNGPMSAETDAAPAGEQARVPSPTAVGVVPLGYPLLGGPGVISVVIAYASGPSGRWLPALVAIAINAVVLLSLMFGAVWITKTVGKTALLVTSKISGLFVLAIAIGGIVKALIAVFPALAGAH